MTLSSPDRTLTRAIAVVAALGGAGVAIYYWRVGLTLTHYDARGHLIVARRIFDSITPGWQQIGAVWLPLPHLLNAIPVQIDTLYRTGASATAISVASFAIASAAITWIVGTITASTPAALAATLVFALNPNVLYLQATPMTEPLLLALTLAAIALLMRWNDDHDHIIGGPLVGWTMALACLTRYEAWPVIGSGLAVTLLARLWRVPALSAMRPVVGLALYSAAAVVGFSIFSRIVVGSWFADGFFVPENPAQGHPLVALSQIVWGAQELSGPWLMGVAGLGIAALLWLTATTRGHSLLPLTLLTTAAVPLVAFFDGHPYRIRYMVPLMAAQAVCAGAALAWVPPRGRPWGAAMLALMTLLTLRPLDSEAAMVVEAQWDRPNIAARDAAVTTCLVRGYDRTSIMASMGSLGHYMQDLSRAGFSLADFLHEGNGDIWLSALQGARPYAGWVLIEEKAEGGDMLAHIAHENPTFLSGFSRVCDGAGLALYRRHAAGSARLDAATRSGR